MSAYWINGFDALDVPNRRRPECVSDVVMDWLCDRRVGRAHRIADARRTAFCQLIRPPNQATTTVPSTKAMVTYAVELLSHRQADGRGTRSASRRYRRPPTVTSAGSAPAHERRQIRTPRRCDAAFSA